MCPPLSERTDRVSDRQREGSPQAQNRPCTSRLYQPTAGTKFLDPSQPAQHATNKLNGRAS